MTAASPTISTPRRAPLAEWLRVATPALLFGLRLWASVCVAFYVAFAAIGSWAGAYVSLTYLHRPPGGPPVGAAPE